MLLSTEESAGTGQISCPQETLSPFRKLGKGLKRPFVNGKKDWGERGVVGWGGGTTSPVVLGKERQHWREGTGRAVKKDVGRCHLIGPQGAPPLQKGGRRGSACQGGREGVPSIEGKREEDPDMMLELRLPLGGKETRRLQEREVERGKKEVAFPVKTRISE